MRAHALLLAVLLLGSPTAACRTRAIVDRAPVSGAAPEAAPAAAPAAARLRVEYYQISEG